MKESIEPQRKLNPDYDMVHHPYKIVQMFEEELANYCGSKYAVAVDSCTNALFLSCKYLKVGEVTIPRRTYLSVPQSIIHAGGKVGFRDEAWKGQYRLEPYPIIDSALRFTSGMYIKGTFMCLSFHYKKHIPIGKGGAILTDDLDAVAWFKKARYEGRSQLSYWSDDIKELGWNMYMTPAEAAVGLSLMQNVSMFQEDSENNGYRNLDEFLHF
ncbi:MAG: DegT/DnrJ/EryC1/StrS aminotransferase family protein [Bacteroidetes bacterium]|nr:DegT/DnrJ/EryC1/StrS aminotransferase family protein [Bacteroidota bacterium]